MFFPLFWGHCFSKGYGWVLKIKFNSRWRFPKLSSDVAICCGLNATSYQNLPESILLLLPLPLFWLQSCYLSSESIRMHQTGHDFWSPKKDIQSPNSSLHVTGGGTPRSLRLLAGGGLPNFWGLHIYIVILFHGAEGLNDFFWQSLKKSLLPFRLILGFWSKWSPDFHGRVHSWRIAADMPRFDFFRGFCILWVVQQCSVGLHPPQDKHEVMIRLPVVYEFLK